MRRFVALALSVALLSFLQIPNSAVATQPAAGGGSWTAVDFTPVDIRVADSNTIISATLTLEFTGTISGTLVCEVDVVVRATGGGTFREKCTFDGTVDGRSGTAVARVAGTLAADGSVEDEFVFGQGTGDLAGLHAQGSSEGIAGVAGTYSVRFHFNDG